MQEMLSDTIEEANALAAAKLASTAMGKGTPCCENAGENSKLDLWEDSKTPIAAGRIDTDDSIPKGSKTPPVSNAFSSTDQIPELVEENGDHDGTVDRPQEQPAPSLPEPCAVKLCLLGDPSLFTISSVSDRANALAPCIVRYYLGIEAQIVVHCLLLL